jgi:hypothetical protein
MSHYMSSCKRSGNETEAEHVFLVLLSRSMQVLVSYLLWSLDKLSFP